MKALSLTQPYASLIVAGYKSIETRPWTPASRFKGDLLICASKSRELEVDSEFLYLLDLLDYPLPLGMALCIVTIEKYAHMTLGDEPRACCRIYPRARSWHLGNIRPIKPFPVTGRLGLFEVEMPT